MSTSASVLTIYVKILQSIKKFNGYILITIVENIFFKTMLTKTVRPEPIWFIDDLLVLNDALNPRPATEPSDLILTHMVLLTERIIYGVGRAFPHDLISSELLKSLVAYTLKESDPNSHNYCTHVTNVIWKSRLYTRYLDILQNTI